MQRLFLSLRLLVSSPTSLSFCGLCCTALLPLGFAACAGSAKVEAKASADTSHGVNFEAESENAWDMEESEEEVLAKAIQEKAEQKPEADSRTPALLGARHDVFLKSAGSASCRCLSVARGAAESALFSWAAPVPKLDPETQQVIALGSEGIACEQNIAPASYAGFEQKGNDLVIYVEEAKDGQPITHGAIIPLVPKGGKLMIQPLAGTQLGLGLKGEASCELK